MICFKKNTALFSPVSTINIPVTAFLFGSTLIPQINKNALHILLVEYTVKGLMRKKKKIVPFF